MLRREWIIMKSKLILIEIMKRLLSISDERSMLDNIAADEKYLNHLDWWLNFCIFWKIEEFEKRIFNNFKYSRSRLLYETKGRAIDVGSIWY